ncbi:MAG: diphosphomevalonate decarboxylase [Flavobacteriaceae bacterium]|jgi:diphosphomevalonate decarboxylase|nr:diphosphomevalonate decarboxylase [Flavobacteriaceae bacterium]
MDNIFKFDLNGIHKVSGQSGWRSPSNIALIKYWGKKEIQIPLNTSLSFTLSNCHTECVVKYEPLKKSVINCDFKLLFEGKREISFEKKLNLFFKRIVDYCPFLLDLKLTIETKNSFPHSSGIASSASSYSALSLCIMDIEKKINPKISSEFFFNKASFLSRLGSGSASRSVLGPLVIWGKTDLFKNSSDLYAVKYLDKVHNNFRNIQDTILLVDKGKKHISSTVGHGLMNDHSFSGDRLNQVEKNMKLLNKILVSGDFDAFTNIVELEALTLHAMMMTSNPYYLLIKPNTLNIINEIWNYRKNTNSEVCFTLDAGANIHMLYPKKNFNTIQKFINEKLSKYCQKGEFINDHVGYGPNKL